MTELNFTAARCDQQENGLWLCLQVAPAHWQKARRYAMQGVKGPQTAQLKRHSKKRSLDANAYFWVLCDRLAQATGFTKEEIYRNTIREIGGVSEVVCMPSKAVKQFCKNWNANGLGCQTETQPSKISGCTNVVVYYGSSTYDTKQMAALIDSIVQDCQAVGIETKTPAELALLVEEWGTKK